MALVLTAIQVIGALLLLVAASDAFTNAVEWIGALYGLTRSTVGAVVAAIGSSMPETVIAAVALLVLRDPSSQAIGIGAVLGAPLMLGTLVFALIGALALRRPAESQTRGRLDLRLPAVTFGLALFVLTFALVIGASFAPALPVRIVASVLVVAAYASYLAYQFRGTEAYCDESPPRLRLRPSAARPHIAAVIAQLGIAVVVTIVASRWFIASTVAAATQIGVAPIVISLILSPIATELPEAMNVAIWMRAGKDDLAVGNVLGAMMFQTSIASTVAMLATPWHLDVRAYAAAAAAFAGALTVLVMTLARRRLDAWPLLASGAFYVGYLVFAAATR